MSDTSFHKTADVVSISATWVALGTCEHLTQELPPDKAVKAIQKLANDLRTKSPTTLAELNNFFATWKA